MNSTDIITDNKSKADIFNSFLSEQSNVDDTIVSLPLIEKPSTKLDSITISETDVLDALSNINTTEASGPDLTSPRILKEGTKELALPLLSLFNESIQTSYFPTI